MLTGQMTGSQTAAGARSARIRAGAATAPAWVCVAARLAWPLCGLLVAIWAISRLLLVPNPDAPPDSTLWHASFLAYAVMGALIVNRRPSNRVGWLFIVVGTFDPLSAAVRSVAATAGTGAFATSTVNVADWLQSWIWAPSMGALGNRAVVYGTLTVVLGVAYLAAVSAMRMLTAPITGDTAVAVAGSTLAVAALFQPARRRVQASVDRRFNRARFDAVATIERFSARLRDEIELDTLPRELVGVVGTTMPPASANLWLRESS